MFRETVGYKKNYDEIEKTFEGRDTNYFIFQGNLLLDIKRLFKVSVKTTWPYLSRIKVY